MVKEDYIEVISGTIPKKPKIPEFQVINDAKKMKQTDNNRMEKSPTVRSNENFELSTQLRQDTSKFSYSTNLNESSEIAISTSTNSQMIKEPKQVAGIISSIKKENTIESRLELSVALINITNQNCLTRFLQLNGTTHLGYWIDDYREQIEYRENVDTKVFDILSNILNFCDKLPISVSDLKFSKIGKKINKLGKCIDNEKKIKSKCEELVARWKKMIENLKDKKKSNDDKNKNDSNYPNEHSDDQSNYEISKSPHKQISNNYHNYENSSLLKKTQRHEIDSSGDKNYKKYISNTIAYFITICLFLFKTIHINSFNILLIFLLKNKNICLNNVNFHLRK